jgi:hypothetical protein
MPAFRTAKGENHQVTLEASLYREAHDANLSVPAFLNRKYGGQVSAKDGSVFHQLCASQGVYLPVKNDLQLRAATIGDILEGKAALEFSADAVVQQRNSDYGGTQSRILFPAAVVDMIENALAKDLETDTRLFNNMVALQLGIASDTFEQPVINYSTNNGPDGATRAKGQRIAQLAEPAAMASFTTSQTPRRLPTWSIGAEFSQQALRNTTLDLVALNLSRFFAVENDARVYEMLSALWSGDPDMNDSAAISAVTSNSLDTSATGGVLTHKAWLKFLYRNRKTRRISHVVCDLDSYLKIEARTGRPGIIAAHDPRLPIVEAQATVQNPYIGDVQVMLVDAAADGGPVPANTVWGVDSRYGIVKVSNTSAAYTAAESFAMKRAEAFRIDWSETAYRQYDAAFDVLTIS